MVQLRGGRKLRNRIDQDQKTIRSRIDSQKGIFDDHGDGLAAESETTESDNGLLTRNIRICKIVVLNIDSPLSRSSSPDSHHNLQRFTFSPLTTLSKESGSLPLSQNSLRLMHNAFVTIRWEHGADFRRQRVALFLTFHISKNHLQERLWREVMNNFCSAAIF